MQPTYEDDRIALLTARQCMVIADMDLPSTQVQARFQVLVQEAITQARTKGFVAGAEWMREASAKIVDSNAVAGGYYAELIRDLPIAAEANPTDLLRECCTLAENARRDLQLVGIGGDSAANLETAKEAIDALLARLEEKSPGLEVAAVRREEEETK